MSVFETQSRSSLHCHCLVWVVGAPATLNQHRLWIESGDYREALARYADAVSRLDFPLFKPEGGVSCLYCQSPLEVIPGPELHRMRARWQTEPNIYGCRLCGTKWAEGYLLESQLGLAGGALGLSPPGPFSVRHVSKVFISRGLPLMRLPMQLQRQLPLRTVQPRPLLHLPNKGLLPR